MVASDEPTSISPASKSFPAASASNQQINVTVPAGQNWTAASNASWIAITAGGAGTGPGVVTYQIGANSSNASNRIGTITVAERIFTVYQGVNFNDVQPGHPYYEDIGKLSARSVTLGTGGGFYSPDLAVDRGQMAAFIIRAVGLFNPPDPLMQRFTDVPPSHVFYKFIDQLALRQITLGCGDGTTYCPGEVVKHEQMAAFIIRGRGEFDPPAPAFQLFADVPPTNAFYKFIDRMHALGIWPGCGTNGQGQLIYCPTDPVKREEMARILVKAFNL
jgi:hypothetical protein